jgi:hypothetical protein
VSNGVPANITTGGVNPSDITELAKKPPELLRVVRLLLLREPESVGIIVFGIVLSFLNPAHKGLRCFSP